MQDEPARVTEGKVTWEASVLSLMAAEWLDRDPHVNSFTEKQHSPRDPQTARGFSSGFSYRGPVAAGRRRAPGTPPGTPPARRKPWPRQLPQEGGHQLEEKRQWPHGVAAGRGLSPPRGCLAQRAGSCFWEGSLPCMCTCVCTCVYACAHVCAVCNPCIPHACECVRMRVHIFLVFMCLALCVHMCARVYLCVYLCVLHMHLCALHVSICICTHVCAHITCVCVSVCAVYAYVCLCILCTHYTGLCVCVCTCTCMPACMQACTRVCMPACLCVCIRVCVCACVSASLKSSRPGV